MIAVHSAQGRDVSSWQAQMDLTGLDFVFVRATIGDGTLDANVTSGDVQAARAARANGAPDPFIEAVAANQMLGVQGKPLRSLFTSSGPGAVSGGVDARFSQFWAQAGAWGKPRGAYHFLVPSLSVTAQAALFTRTVKTAGLKPGDMIVVDSEENAPDVDGVTRTFLDLVSGALGRWHPYLTYSNHDVGQHLTRTAAKYPDLWFAWPSPTAPFPSLYAPWPRWRFWQWGTVAGVDANAFDGTAADLAAWLASYQQEGPDMANLPGKWRRIFSVTPFPPAGAPAGPVLVYIAVGEGTDGCFYKIITTDGGVTWGGKLRISDPVDYVT